MTSIVASFDIGKKNFAFIVEKVDTEKLKSIENVPVTKRYKKDGTPTDKFQTLLIYYANSKHFLMILRNERKKISKITHFRPK